MVYGQAPNHWLAESSGILDIVPKAGQVVELASGEGRNAVWLAEQGYLTVGVDISAAGVAKSQAFAKARGIPMDMLSFETGDATTFGKDNSFDAVVGVFAHVPPPMKKAFFENMVRIVKPGGRVIGQWYTPTHVDRKNDPAIDWGKGGPPDAAACETAAPACHGSLHTRPRAVCTGSCITTRVPSPPRCDSQAFPPRSCAPPLLAARAHSRCWKRPMPTLRRVPCTQETHMSST